MEKTVLDWNFGGDLLALRTWMSKSFPRFGKFSAIISLHSLSTILPLSSPSAVSMIQTLFLLMVSHYSHRHLHSLSFFLFFPEQHLTGALTIQLWPQSRSNLNPPKPSSACESFQRQRFNSLCQCWQLSSDSPLGLNLNSCHRVLSTHFLLSFSWE